MSEANLSARVELLRQEFDRRFAVAPVAAAAPAELLLAVRVAGEPYALRVAELSGVALDRPCVPVPGGATGLVGLAGVRGELMAVFGLAELLGHARPAQPGRFLVFSPGPAPVAFNFELLERQVRVAPGELTRAPASAASPFFSHIARIDGASRPVISVGALLRELQSRAAQGGAPVSRSNP